jgi:amino acid permease
MDCDKIVYRLMGGYGGHIDVKFWRSVALMIGGILGVGVFGLPYLFVRSGLAAGLVSLVALAAAVGVLNLMYGEIVMRTAGKHRLGGYVKEYLGAGWGVAASLVMVAALVGALVAFLIVGGRFLHDLFGPTFGGPEWMYALGLSLAVGVASVKGVRLAAQIESPVVCVLLLLFAILVLASLPHAHVSNVVGATSFAAVPFGAVLFALSGGGIIPDMRELLGSRARRQLPLAVTLGLAAVVIICAAFATAVVSVTGTGTTPVAFEGLIPVLGPSFALITLLLGSVAVFSISLTNTIQLSDILRIDQRLPPKAAWAIATVSALLLYLLGARSFIATIGFVGAVFGGTVGLFIIATYEKMKRDTVCRHAHCLEVPTIVSALLAFVFVAAMLLELTK